MSTLNAQMYIRRDTAADWTSTNPTLAAGEIGYETDTLKYKIGDGTTAWTSLEYWLEDAEHARVLVSEIKTNNTTAKDLAITCGANKTIELGTVVYRDELQDLTIETKNNPSSNITDDITEGTVSWSDSADLNDYAFMNIQINHDWKIGTTVYPHIHWFQNQNNSVNWLVQYRWQVNEAAKTTAWTDLAMDSLAFTYSSGALNQISHTAAGLTPPVGAGLSDILQCRLIRDTNNDSGEFSGTDAYTGDADAMNFDIHVQINTLGSRQEFIK